MATLEEYISRLRREVQERAEKQNAESTETDMPVEAEATTETEQKAEAYDYLTGRTESEVESNE